MNNASNKLRHKKNKIGLIIVAIIGMIIAAFVGKYAYDFNQNDTRMKSRADSVFRKIAIPPGLELRSKSYSTDPFWATDYSPRWIYNYRLTADKKIVYDQLKQAFINACGPNTPEYPGRVGGDEEKYTYLDTRCENVAIKYKLTDDTSATLKVIPY